MNETTKTLAFAGVALVLLAAASLASWLPDRRGSSTAFNDQGELFFPEFAETIDEDPLAARALEVVEYDEDTASVRPFQVQLENGEWTIPSHHDYPADAQDKLAQLAAQVAQLTKDAIRSDRTEDHQELGVLDPLDEDTTTLQGRGTRVTLRATPGGEALADFIIGKPVPDREGLRYVRLPGKNRTYAANVDLDLSTRFADWIDTDLLDVNASQVERLTYDTRKVNLEQLTASGSIPPSDPIVLEKTSDTDGDGQPDWTMEDLDSDQQVNQTKVGDVIRAVDNLRIVGVRPMPATRNAMLQSLVNKGFYPTQQGDLLSTEGSLRVATHEGLVYTLRFGEVTFASGEALTAGTGEDQDPSAESESETKAETKDESASEEDDGQEEQTESRYLIVSVEFDPDLIPSENDDAETDRLPDDLFARDKDDPVRVAAEKKAAEEAQREQEERDRKIKQGQEKVEELNRAFANWYYVVPGDDFRKVALDREAFLQQPGDATSPAPPTNLGPGGLPPGFSPGGLPGGVSLPGVGSPH